MRHLLLLLLTAGLHAAPLTDPYALLEPGNRLVYDFGIWNYWIHRGELPDRVRVSLAGPVGQVGTLNGWIESTDGLESAPFTLTISQGRYSRNGQWTPISLAVGIVDVPDSLWGSTARNDVGARLIVEGEYTIGRGAPYPMAASAIGLSLMGPGVSMGAAPAFTAVREIESLTVSSAAAVPMVENPEPGTWALLATGGVMLWIRRRCTQS